MTDLQRLDYQGHTIRVVPDEDPTDPREWDNLGTIVYTSHRYYLGDERVTPDEIAELEAREDVIALPVYAYIHGGVSLSTGPFGCRWDSGQCGIVYVEHDAVRREYKAEPDEVRDRVLDVLRAEVDTFSRYLGGEVVGYVIELDGEPVESCWGYYDVEDAIAQAKAEVDASPRVLFPHPCTTDLEAVSCSS
jgi:hypothetical protein